MFILKTLAQTDLGTIHRCFTAAFSDYQIEIDMPLAKFRLMLQRRGFEPELSVGAFAGGALVGVILNCRRVWKGEEAIYDNITGVVPEYRRQGITSAMFQEVLNLCRIHGIHRYWLEVIATNAPAVELYTKRGFRIVRTFACYRAEKHAIPAATSDGITDAKHLGGLDWDQLRSYWDYEPSWQNSIASILAAPDAFAAVLAHLDGEPAGYGIVEKKTGDVPQLAVAKHLRGRGIGGGILSALSRRSEAAGLSFLNVEADCPSSRVFLEKAGFTSFAEQYEMSLDIR